eukprot:m.206768 g.206768  ORF g.206768 m.206768 type:complete len:394 (-) comp32967_c1_seq1:2180-3361(-)
MANNLLIAIFVAVLAVFSFEIYILSLNFKFPSAPQDATLTMQAAVYTEHGPASNIKVVSTAQPQQTPTPKGTIAIKVVAAALNPVDFKLRRNDQPDFVVPKPKIVGADVSGIVIAVGEGVTDFAVGDKVFAMLPIVGTSWGSLAEFVTADAAVFGKAPTTISLVDAAALPLVGLTVLQVLDQAGIYETNSPAAAGKTALVQAGAGGVGSFAIQYVSKVLGFSKVYATCSAANSEFVKNLGATDVIDYHTTNFEDVVENADLVIDPMSYAYMNRTWNSNVLNKSGDYAHILSTDWAPNDLENNPFDIFQVAFWKWVSTVESTAFPGRRARMHSSPVKPSGQGLNRIASYVDAGKITPVIDRKYKGLEHIVEATEYLEQGHAHGKVVICIDANDC